MLFIYLTMWVLQVIIRNSKENKQLHTKTSLQELGTVWKNSSK